ncbi:hypothetical protein AHIS1_p060 [Acaryochloris phage A-HIS1]|nr:hypothetical protein AHIS1_p060 [Acaryochloris phage A-HIS1]
MKTLTFRIRIVAFTLLTRIAGNCIYAALRLPEGRRKIDLKKTAVILMEIRRKL